MRMAAIGAIGHTRNHHAGAAHLWRLAPYHAATYKRAILANPTRSSAQL